jgi:molybdopterin synthase catalytic subunit
VLHPQNVDDWQALTYEPLPVVQATEWATQPHCGAVVSFIGTVRDHSDGRSGVSRLEYEAYEELVGPRMSALAEVARRRWPGLGRVALLHRVGTMEVGDASVLVVVSAPHRAEAFEAARWCIDTLMTTVHIWKR